MIKLNFELADCEPQGVGVPHAGVEHLALLVDNLDATLTHVKALPETKITKEPFMSGSLRCAFITGPEGVLVEVMEETA